ncbi:hypothetical protein ACFSLT_03075 [Novosphingobium resinovorum]
MLLVITLAVFMPLFGLSLGLATVLEVSLGRVVPRIRVWMGWRTAA